MSDPTLPDHSAFEAWLARELRCPLPPRAGDASRTARVMARVRASAVPARRRPRWAPPTVALALAAGLAAFAALGPLALAARPYRDGGEGGGAAIAAHDSIAAALRDTLRGVVRTAVRDTMRLVHFALVAPGASRVALAGDFNGWAPRATPLTRRGGDATWRATVALGPGAHRYGFVVNDTQWVGDSAAPDGSGRRWSVWATPDTSN